LREAQLYIYRNPGKIGDRARSRELESLDEQPSPKPATKKAAAAHPRLWAAWTISGGISPSGRTAWQDACHKWENESKVAKHDKSRSALP